MSIDIKRLKVDSAYWDEVAPVGAAYYMPETEYTCEIWVRDDMRTCFHVVFSDNDSPRWFDDGIEYETSEKALMIPRPQPSTASLLTDAQAEARMGEPIVIERTASQSPKYPHYFKDVSGVDAIDLYEINDPALFHAFKKIACAGKRGSKGQAQDVQEAIDALKRWQELNK